MRNIFYLTLLITNLACSADTVVKLDDANIDLNDGLSIQRGARTYINYCLGCHQASYMRFNRLGDIGLSKEQIKEHLILGQQKIGSPMLNNMSKEDAESWFGVLPPDLSVIARSRGADWLYTYLRSFYRDSKTATGWNNLLFPNVGMPHILWEIQGVLTLKASDLDETRGELAVISKGHLNKIEYDGFVRDLVNYLVFMGEPARTLRVRIGIVILFALSIFLVLAWILKKEYWKDVTH